MSSKDNPSCESCGEIALFWEGHDPQGRTYSGRFCKDCSWHKVQKFPRGIKFEQFLERNDEVIFTLLVAAFALFLVSIPVYVFGEGKVTYCYVSYSSNSARVCLYGHEDWRTDRKFMCSNNSDASKAYSEMAQGARNMSCPLEYGSNYPEVRPESNVKDDVDAGVSVVPRLQMYQKQVDKGMLGMFPSRVILPDGGP